MTRIEHARVLCSEDVAPGVGLLTFESESIAEAYLPGHFVHLKTGDGATILRRPFSISRVDGSEVMLLYRIIGVGTEWMRARRKGDLLDMMAPLGSNFGLRTRARRTLLVGGGLGMAPLLGVADSLRDVGYDAPVEALLGIRSGREFFEGKITDRSEHLEWHVATDDGSRGFHGNVVELLARRLEEVAKSTPLEDVAIYAAGPEPMLEATAQICLPHGLDLQVSMEAHMACAVGACRACGIVTYRDEDRLNGRVCREGPVFEASSILWEGMAC